MKFLKKATPLKQHGSGIREVIIAAIANARTDDSGNKVVSISPITAARILAETNWPGQRKVSGTRLLGKRRLIVSGEWDAATSEIQFAVTPDGTIYLVDGQHRLTAIVDTGIAVDTRISIIKARSIDHVRQIYARLDSKESVRTTTDVLLGVGAPGRLGLSKSWTAALFNAMPILLDGIERVAPRTAATISRDTQYRLSRIDGWQKEAKQYAAICASADAWILRKLRSQGVMAVALHTLRYQPRMATSFWKGVADNDRLPRKDPRARLLADFQQRDLTRGSIRQSIQRVAAAWNAFYQGRELSRIKCHDDSEIVILGTPKAGKGNARAA